jgi:hypothetical protein
VWFVPLALLGLDLASYDTEVRRVHERATFERTRPEVCTIGSELSVRSEVLTETLHNPMPGGITAGYAVDTGLDIVGTPRDVFVIASGTVDYAEAGHTAWTSPSDSPYSIRIKLDAPLEHPRGRVTHLYYSHLSRIAFQKKEGEVRIIRVEAGERIACSGQANHVNHLHLGMLLDGQTSQRWGTYLLEDEVREVLGGLGHRRRLPNR